MKKILIPVDGSDYSERAIEKAKELATAFNSDIVIFNAIPVTIAPTGRIHFDVQVLVEENRKASEALLEKSREKLGDYPGKVETVAMHGDAPSAIVQYAKENGVDLIIMGSHGMGAVMNRILTGSVTTKVLHHTDIPVLVIK